MALQSAPPTMHDLLQGSSHMSHSCYEYHCNLFIHGCVDIVCLVTTEEADTPDYYNVSTIWCERL